MAHASFSDIVDFVINHVQSTTVAGETCKLPFSFDTAKQYDVELKKLNKENLEFIKEMNDVEAIVNKNYPDLSIAHAVQNECSWRFDDEERLRVRIGLKAMSRNAKAMIEDALGDQLDMLTDIETKMRFNQAAIKAVEVNRRILRKRVAQPCEEKDEESKKARFD